VTGVAHEGLAAKLESVLDPAAEENGLELVAVEQAGGRKAPVIRVLLDREGGINLDALCEANGWVEDAIEKSGLVRGSYTLEVSSPGVDRPLRKREDFERFAGETATVKAKQSAGARTTWTGVLLGVEGDSVLIESDGKRFDIPFESVVKARLKGVVCFSREGVPNK